MSPEDLTFGSNIVWVFFFFGAGSSGWPLVCNAASDNLELLISCLQLSSVGVTGMHHHTLHSVLYKFYIFIFVSWHKIAGSRRSYYLKR